MVLCCVAPSPLRGTTVNLTDVSKTDVIHGTHGDLTITGWNSATGELDYSYTLTKADSTPVSGATNQGANLDINGEDFHINATDKDGDTGAAATWSVVTASVGMQGDDLVVRGTPAGDRIFIKPANGPGHVGVVLNGVSAGVFQPRRLRIT